MKPEPLKDKKHFVDSTFNMIVKDIADNGLFTRCFLLRDVKSAVEWLRLKLMLIIEDEHDEEDINDIIIKAFPDLEEVKGDE